MHFYENCIIAKDIDIETHQTPEWASRGNTMRSQMKFSPLHTGSIETRMISLRIFNFLLFRFFYPRSQIPLDRCRV